MEHVVWSSAPFGFELTVCNFIPPLYFLLIFSCFRLATRNECDKFRTEDDFEIISR